MQISVRRPAQNVVRDWISFIVGVAGVVYETGFEHADRPTLYVLFGAMIGLPAFLTGGSPESAPAPTPAPLPPTPVVPPATPPVP